MSWPIVTASPAAAAHCVDITAAGVRGGTFQAGGSRVCNPDGSTQGSAQGYWALYCSGLGPHAPGNEVTLQRDIELQPGDIVDGGRIGGQPGTIIATEHSYRWQVRCTTPAGTSLWYYIVVPVGEDPVDPIAVRNEALASLRIPDPDLGGSPPLDDPDRFSVVRIPTWLWVNQSWEQRISTATDGPVTVRVFAEPTHVTWDPGDETGTFDCFADAIPWEPGMDEDDANCSHTYRQASTGQDGNAYELTATVHWNLTWELNGVDQGLFDTYAPLTTITHAVGEIQSVIVRGEPDS